MCEAVMNEENLTQALKQWLAHHYRWKAVSTLVCAKINSGKSPIGGRWKGYFHINDECPKK